MKHSIPLLFIALAVWTSCGKSGEHAHHAEATDTTNAALYEMVMGVHDEVMPRMEELYTLKKKIQDTLEHTKGLVAEKKAELEMTIAGLDSASAAMMDWMHNFNMPDSTDQEKARDYLETEIERIKKVQEMTNEIILKAREQTGKK